VGFAVQAMGAAGKPVIRGVEHIQRVVFRVLAMIMWAAPVGAFGAIAGVVGETGLDALKSLAILMLAFYITCAVFVFGMLGTLLKLTTGVNLFSLLRYLGREYLLIVSTSSSESALPRLIAKMEHAGVDKPTVGVVVPTGYSFNLDGTAIYLTMASLFIADALDKPFSIGQQISLLVFMIIASKGAAGVTGAGLATLAGGSGRGARRNEGIVQLDRVHPPGPHEQGIRGIRIAEIAVTTAFDDKPELVLASYVDRRGDVACALGGNDHLAGLRRPGVRPAERLGQRRLVTQVIRILQSLEERVGSDAARASGGNERRVDRDQPRTDASAQFRQGAGAGNRPQQRTRRNRESRGSEQSADKSPAFHQFSLFKRFP